MAVGAVMVTMVVALRESLGFIVAPGNMVRTALGGNALASASPAELMEVPRGESSPRTQMRGQYKEGRSRKNMQGGGRLPIRVNRNPVLAYSKGDSNEPGGSVLRRMWDMYDLDFNKMVAMRQRYHRPGYRNKKWTADYNMRLGRRKKDLKVKKVLETEWQQWMRTEGRKQGFLEPILFAGPPLKLTPEEDAACEPSVIKAKIPSVEEMKKNWLPRLPKGRAKLGTDELEPGKWNDDGPDNIFKIWKRPLHKWPYDIGKRGRKGPVVRGVVM